MLFVSVVKLGKPYIMLDIPRFTKEGEEELARKYADQPLYPNATLRDLYQARITSVLTALSIYFPAVELR